VGLLHGLRNLTFAPITGRCGGITQTDSLGCRRTSQGKRQSLTVTERLCSFYLLAFYVYLSKRRAGTPAPFSRCVVTLDTLERYLFQGIYLEQDGR
jgi:hypothetical protein